MARYFFGNTLAAFFRSTTGVIEDTAAGHFDSTFVQNAIRLSATSDFLDTMPFIDASSATTLGMRWSWYFGSSGAVGVTWPLLEFFDLSGTVVGRLVIKAVGGFSTPPTFQYWNGTTFVDYLTANAALGESVLKPMAAKFVCGASGTFDLWTGGTKIIDSALGSGMNAAVDNISMVRFHASWSSNAAWVSEVLGADYDLRDSHYLCQLATGEGHYVDGTGVYTDINEVQLDDSTNIVLPASANKHTFVHAAITVPQGYAIAAGTVAARGRVSGGTITDGKLMFRSGVTDSLSTGRSYNAGYEPRGFYLDNDPATVSPWTQTGYNAAEFGAAAP